MLIDKHSPFLIPVAKRSASSVYGRASGFCCAIFFGSFQGGFLFFYFKTIGRGLITDCWITFQPDRPRFSRFGAASGRTL